MDTIGSLDELATEIAAAMREESVDRLGGIAIALVSHCSDAESGRIDAVVAAIAQADAVRLATLSIQLLGQVRRILKKREGERDKKRRQRGSLAASGAADPPRITLERGHDGTGGDSEGQPLPTFPSSSLPTPLPSSSLPPLPEHTPGARARKETATERQLRETIGEEFWPSVLAFLDSRRRGRGKWIDHVIGLVEGSAAPSDIAVACHDEASSERGLTFVGFDQFVVKARALRIERLRSESRRARPASSDVARSTAQVEREPDSLTAEFMAATTEAMSRWQATNPAAYEQLVTDAAGRPFATRSPEALHEVVAVAWAKLTGFPATPHQWLAAGKPAGPAAKAVG